MSTATLRESGPRTLRGLSHRKYLAIALIVALAAALCFIITNTPDESSAATSGTCGENLIWEYNTETGALTISGTGPMTDYSFTDTRWDGNVIRSVTFSEGVTTVGQCAFYNCATLESVSIPATVVSVKSYSFEYCVALESIVIPDSVTGIGDAAFSGCTGLTSATFGTSLKSFGASAFRGCTSLASVDIPASVTNMNTLVFYEDSSLTAINVDPGNTAYASEDGVLFNKAKTNLMQYPASKGDVSYTVPSTVKTIQYRAFWDAVYVKNITLPSDMADVLDGSGNVKTYAMGSNTFEGCISLVSMDLPEGITAIREAMFKGCASLEYVTYGSKLNKIEGEAFSGCASLSTFDVPALITTVNANMFSKCSGLQTLNIHAGVTTISKSAACYFSGCTSLTTLNVDSGNANYSTVDGVLYDKTGQTLLCYPQGKSATTFSIPATVKTIGQGAFGYVPALETITVPSTVSSIGDYAFYRCEGLTSVSLPSTITSIPNYSFADCVALTEFTVPAGVKTIASGAFNGCKSLVTIYVDANNGSFSAKDGILYNKAGTELRWYPIGRTVTSFTIPDGVTSIGERAFNGNSTLTSIILPDTVTSIGNYAFYHCSALESFTIPSGVTEICANTFNGCTSLESISIPSTVTSIGSNAFYGCTALPLVEIPASVTTIGVNSFSHCESFTSLTLPEGVTTLGEGAFNYCYALESVSLPNTLTTLSTGVFSYDTALKSVVIPEGITTIPTNMFSYCTTLAEVTIPDSVELLDRGSFQGCNAFTYISFGKGITTIDMFQFQPAFSATMHFYDGNGDALEVTADNMRGNTFRLVGDKLTRFYTVAYDSNGGSNVASESVKEGSVASQPANPTKDYYTFACWCTDEDLTNEYDFADPVEANFTLFAKWSPVSYDLSYVLNGGTNVPGNPATYTIEDSFSLQPAEWTGHDFLGWYLDPEFSGDPVTEFTAGAHGNKTLYADWQLKTVTITFVTGEGGSAVSPITQEYGTPVSAPADPTKTGSTFVEWRLDGVKYIFTTMPADDIELVAEWKLNTYTITFDTAGADPMAPLILEYGAEISVDAPERIGYDFQGWDPELPDSMPDHDLSVTATWEAHELTVVFDVNGGVPLDPDSIDVVFGEQYDLVIPKHSNPEKYFSGWMYNDSIIPVTGTWAIDDDITVVAQWADAPTYEVRFEGGEGTEGQAAIVRQCLDGTVIEMPDNTFTRIGYDFSGWKAPNGSVLQPGAEYTVDSAVSFVAQWTAKEYDIAYFVDGVQLTDPEYVGLKGTYNTQVDVKPAYVRTGYDVTPWSAGDLIPIVDGKITMPAGDVRFDATISAHAYAITLQIEGGTPGSAIATYDAKITDFIGASRTGYNITGYAAGDEIIMTVDGKLIAGVDGYTDADGNWIKAADTTLTAQVLAIKVSVTVNYAYADGSIAFDPYQQDLDYGSQYSVETPFLVGYTPDKEVVSGVVSLEPVDVTVIYTVNKYTIHFDSNGGSTVADIIQDYGTAVTAPEDPIRPGYTFTEWRKDGVAYPVPAIMPAEDLNLVAFWTVKNVTITFNSNGGSEVAPITQEYGTPVTKPADPTRTGFTFEKWNPSVPSTMPATDLEVVASWTRNQYSISFDSAGGSEVNTIVANYEAAITAPEDPVRDGYDFAGWLKDGVPYVIPATMPAENIMLTASWKAKTATITFNSDGGSPVAPITQEYGTPVTKPADPTKEGYRFTGWNPEVPATMPAEDLVVTATWEILKFTVTFDGNGATGTMDPVVLDWNTVFKYPAPTFTAPSGTEFKCWIENGEEKAVGTTVNIKADITLIARWVSVPVPQPDGKVDFNSGSDEVVIDMDNAAISAAVKASTAVDVSGDGWEMEIPKEIVSGATGEVSASAKTLSDAEKAALPAPVREKVQGKTVYSLNLSDANGAIGFGGKKVTVSLPYVLKDGESASNVKVFFINGDKLVEYDANYDADKEVAVFEADHFSDWFVDVVASSDNGGGFPIWIVAVIAVVAIIAIGAVFFIKKKA